jgi:acyl-CoA synthetase (AMP-forming)/AMP-acid ligase II
VNPGIARSSHDIALTIPGLAFDGMRQWPDEIAIIDGCRRVTFKMLVDQMMGAAAGFIAAGLQEGERVCLWAENSADWIVACLGLQAAGGILVPLNTRFRGEEAIFITARAKAVMAVVSDGFLGFDYAGALANGNLPGLRRIVPLGGAIWKAFLAAATESDRAEAERRCGALSADNLSDIMFTSGTTGEPKGAMSTHRQTVVTAHLWAQTTSLRKGDRFLVLWPFFHCSGYKAGWVVNLAVGAVTLPQAVLDLEQLVSTVEREQVTFLPGPPTLFQTILAEPTLDRTRLASIRVSITGASSVAPSLIQAIRHDLHIPNVLTGYGLTESCGTLTMTGPDDPPEIVTTSCGRALDGIELAIVDTTNRRLPVGEVGEIVARGMNIMTGYLDDPEATATAIDAEGWLHTGDIGTLDTDGYLRITDRKKDMYIVGGFNCYPAEIEKMLAAHPAIYAVAVTGVPDERMGEVGKAWVVLAPGANLTAAALIDWCRTRMANFKMPRHIAFLDVLPMNATGKVLKFKLADMPDQGSA